MKRTLKKLFCLVALICSSNVVISQEIPPIRVFTPQDYNAEDQNWAISQSDDRIIYVANNKGILEYNGASWQLHASPNESIIRSVLASNDLIYTGAYMDFGYWTKNEANELNYTSIVKELSLDVKEDEEFWGIIEVGEFTIFQSFERIYIYNKDDAACNIIETSRRINKIFKVKGGLYFHEIGGGIFKIENGKARKVISFEQKNQKEIVNIFEMDEGLVLLTKQDGLLSYSDGELSSMPVLANQLLQNRTIYSGLMMKNGSIVLGTISNGIIILDADGNIEMEIDQEKGLSNNTVLSLFEDVDGNIWLGLDNGINVINLNSPFRVYTDKLGQLGTVYASELFNDYLYLGTNQGLFFKNLNEKSGEFRFVKGTNGQVWSLDVLDGTLFCGHDNGTYIINRDKAQQISKVKGTWGVKEIPDQTDLLLQGSYKGIHILEKLNGKWQYKNKVQGFDISSRYFEILSSDRILVSHEYKGVYKIEVNTNFTKIINYEKLDLPAGIKSSIASYNNKVLYASNKGVFTYDLNKESFSKDSIISQHITSSNYHSGKLIFDKDRNRLWAFTKSEMLYLEPGQMTEELEINSIAIPENLRKNKAGFENLLYLDNNKYLIGGTTGYFILDLNKIELTQNSLIWSGITSYSGQNPSQALPIAGNLQLPNSQTSINFSFGVPAFNEFNPIQYQYKLEGLYDSWSNWSLLPEVVFENLPYGDYTFKARAKSNGSFSKNILSYNFQVDKPWYLKPIAITSYVVAFLLIAFLMHYGNRSYYKRQKRKLVEKRERERELERLENQKQLVEFKNENLQLDIDNKNRELGMATMNLVKRNELLNDIKVGLAHIKTADDVKKVTRLINNNLNDSNDWKLFEEAFNNVDKDFMKRVKKLHPAITPNDLRLCAYLRLNLSSKEIAPLLNISHKSVEVKRYRLRKKMNLEHDVSLSNYIINL